MSLFLRGRALLLAGGLCLVLALIVVSSRARADVEPLRILMIGDSITAGVRVSDSQYYPGLLAERLGDDYEIIERGCSSTTTSMWLPPGGSKPVWPMWCRGERAPSLYATFAYPELPADIVTIMLGTNDALFTWISDVDYGGNLAEIAGALLEDGAGTVVLMTPPDHPAPDSWLQSYRLALLSERVRILCESMPGVVCGPDVYELLADDSDFSLVGGERNVHPSAAGHARIADALQDLVVDLSPAPACEDESRPRSIERLCTVYCRWLECDSLEQAGSANLCGHLERHIRRRSASTWRICGDDPPWSWRRRIREAPGRRPRWGRPDRAPSVRPGPPPW